jgi:hypothetical protein
MNFDCFLLDINADRGKSLYSARSGPFGWPTRTKPLGGGRLRVGGDLW